MRFLSVAERELRAAARRKGTYRLRWIAGLGFFGLLLWLAWAFDLFANRNNAPEVFQIFATVIFLFCLMVGATGTADCISREKREGTLGLLFLTNLNSAEIVAGKLCANALASIYCLLAIFPVLALPLMVGGITFAEFGRVVLAELNALFFAIAAGFVASAVSVRQFPAVAFATALALFFGLALLGVAEVMRGLGCPRYLTDFIAAFCPLNGLRLATFGWRAQLAPDYWTSLSAVAAMSASWLALVAWGLRHSWRDRPKSPRRASTRKLVERLRTRGAEARLSFRRRLLGINPYFWLASRQRVSAPVFMALIVVVCAVTSFVAGPYFGQVMMKGSTTSALLGQLFAWGWAGLAIHGFVLYYAAAAASRQLAEDKQSGALELVLSTPTSERVIARGLWLAYGRRMFFPALVAVLVHCYFIWTIMTVAVLDPPGRLPPGATAGEIFWCALWGWPLRGHTLDWQFGFMLHIVLLFLAGFAACWVMLGWLGRWLGLRMKHPGFAPLVGVTLAIVPPVLLFSLVCYVAGEWRMFRLPERQFLPIMMWVAFGITLLNCLVLSMWAAGHLREDFRATVTGRYSESTRRWWQVNWPRVRRLALRWAGLCLGLMLVVAGYYGYQNWRGQRAWNSFQAELRQQGRSLDLTPLLPRPVPDAENFARSPAFGALQARLKSPNETKRLFDQMQHFQVANNLYGTLPEGVDWMQQQPSSLSNYLRWINPKFRISNATNRTECGAAILEGLKPLAGLMRELTVAAQLPALQFTTNRAAEYLLSANSAEIFLLERLQMLFQIRACAGLAAGRTNDAAEDLLTGLRLARLARQLPDARAAMRVQFMLARTLQPLWDGLAKHSWSESQLASFQRELATFNLLADYTNAIHRLRLLYIDCWRGADATANLSGRPGGVRGAADSEAAWQPAAWRFYNCMQLYQAGERAIERVDVAGERVRDANNWEDTNGLPMEPDTRSFFQQATWWGGKPTQVSFAQTSLNQALLACALERYFLARGTYPDALEQLLPAWLDRLPHDTERGRPMIYECVMTNQFILRGVGPNGLNERTNKNGDDWLWTY